MEGEYCLPNRQLDLLKWTERGRRAPRGDSIVAVDALVGVRQDASCISRATLALPLLSPVNGCDSTRQIAIANAVESAGSEDCS